MKQQLVKHAGWICSALLCCVLLGVALYIATQEKNNTINNADSANNAYTQLVNCAIYYNELESYGEQRPEMNQENFHNLIWNFLEPYRKQHISTNERYVWGDYNEQSAYLLFFLKHYYDECLEDG